MNLHALTDRPDEALALALTAFEAQFRYPLGSGTSFSISHGKDYLTFFSAIGHATLFVAEDARGVAGTLAAVLRPLRFPDGTTRTVGYLCDLKVRPDARREPMVALFTAVEKHLRGLGLAHACGVVMDGSRRTPLDYTGRLGIPAFVPVSKITLLRIHCTRPEESSGETREVPRDEFTKTRAGLLPRGYVTLGGAPELRSEQAPVRLATTDARACGLLEDTRRGKRLLLDSGEELRAAHLSEFAFADAVSAGAILREAAARCARAGIPTLFAALPAGHAVAVSAGLAELSIHPASATIYGCQMEPTPDDWWITSAEI